MAILCTYTCMDHNSYSIVRTRVPIRTTTHTRWYHHGTRVPMVPYRSGTKWYMCTYWYTCTYNIHCSGRCHHRRHHGILPWYGSNSTAMSAARISTTILASIWACTRTSACIASLTMVPLVYVVPGTHVLHTNVPWYDIVCTYVRTYVRTCVRTMVPGSVLGMRTTKVLEYHAPTRARKLVNVHYSRTAG